MYGWRHGVLRLPRGNGRTGRRVDTDRGVLGPIGYRLLRIGYLIITRHRLVAGYFLPTSRNQNRVTSTASSQRPAQGTPSAITQRAYFAYSST